MPLSDCTPAFILVALEKLQAWKLKWKFRKLEGWKLKQKCQLNQAPGAPQQIESLKEFISLAEKELMKYKETKVRAIALKNELNALEEQIEFAKSLFAPIRKLPYEILSKIFIAHGKENILKQCVARILGYAIVSVCSHWRYVARTTPELWTNISIATEGQIQTDNRLLPNAWVKDFLTLSATANLHLTVQINKTDPIPLYLPSLFEHPNRWESLRGACENDSILEMFYSLKGRFHSLQTFELTLPPASLYRYRSDLLDGAPKLHVVTLTNINPDRITILWKQITDLCFHQCRLPEVVNCLPRFSKLSALNFSHLSGTNINDNSRSIYSNIHTLKLHIGDDDEQKNTKNLLNMLILPNLQHLSLVYVDYNGKLQWETGIFAAHSSGLTSFDLDGVLISTNDLIPVLQVMPTLTTLRLCKPRDIPPISDNPLLRAMRYSQERPPLLPRLLFLTLQHCQFSSSSLQLLINLIHSRREPVQNDVADIQTVRLIRPSGKVHQKKVQSLVMLRTRGLNISIVGEDWEVTL